MITLGIVSPFQILMILIIVVIPSVITGFIGRYIAIQKGRSKTEGFLLGFFLSLFGILIEALLPSQNKN